MTLPRSTVLALNIVRQRGSYGELGWFFPSVATSFGFLGSIPRFRLRLLIIFARQAYCRFFRGCATLTWDCIISSITLLCNVPLLTKCRQINNFRALNQSCCNGGRFRRKF